jgi:hypothetical protein
VSPLAATLPDFDDVDKPGGDDQEDQREQRSGHQEPGAGGVEKL